MIGPIIQKIQNMHIADPDDVIRTGGRMPIVASVIDAGKNIGSSMNLGYNLASGLGGDGFRKGANLSTHIGSVGGALTFGGLAIPGAIAGAGVGALMDGGDIGTTAAIGAGIGLAAPLAIGAAGYGIEKLGSGLVKSVINPVRSASEIGATGRVAGGIGSDLYKAGRFAWNTIDNPISRGQVNMLKKMSHHIVNFDSVKINPESKMPIEGLEGVKLGWLGNVLFYGGALKQASTKAFDTYMKAHMGQIDPYVTTATPKIPVYADNSGATGDLVFALNRNRRG